MFNRLCVRISVGREFLDLPHSEVQTVSPVLLLGIRLPYRVTLKIERKNTIMSDKSEIIKDNQVHEKDTGSCEVQIALLSTRISSLTEHLRENRKDFHSRRGLLKMTSRRRKLLDYLKKHAYGRYEAIIKKLNLRR